MFNPAIETWTKHHTARGQAYFRRGAALVAWDKKCGEWTASAFGIDLRGFSDLTAAQAYLDAAPDACTAAQVVAAHYAR